MVADRDRRRRWTTCAQMQECCHTQAGHGECRKLGQSGRLKPKPRHHPRRRYRSGEDQYAPEVEAPAPVHESLRSSGRTLPHPAWPSAQASCLPLQPVHGYKCHAGVGLAVPVSVNDPRLATIRRQLVRRRSREQDLLPKFQNGWTYLRARPEQIRQNGICEHGTSPSRYCWRPCSPGWPWSM